MIKLPHECGRKVFYARGLTLRNPNLRQEAWSEHIPKIAVSNYVYRELLKAGDDGVVAVVPNGIDRDEYFPDNAQEDRIAVGTVYGSGIAKDPQTILSVFDMLHKSRPNLPLICFSSERRFGSLTQTVQCEYLPSVAKARKLYSKCAVWFCASRSEGFGNPLLEAMACGCAVVCADCGGPNDFLKSGINGVIVEKGAPDKMVSEILNIIDDKSKRTQMVNIAFEIVKTLSWSYAAHKMEIAMGRIISNQKC
jgi:glycosyltransferase involved in cell wall biosynthesis